MPMRCSGRSITRMPMNQYSVPLSQALLRKPMCHEFSSVGEMQVLRFLKRYG